MDYRFSYLRFPGGKAKAVTFSYDDGCPEDVKTAETLTKYNLKGTFNLNGSGFRNGKCITPEQVKEFILDKGHEVAVHGAIHRPQGALRTIEGIRDVLDCRLELEKIYGRIIRGMAYPNFGVIKFMNNASYESVKNYLSELDIAYSRTLGGDNDQFDLPTDWHKWMPTAHHDNPQIMEYIDKFLNIKFDAQSYRSFFDPKLFYIWGHSFEFERNKNWEHLTEICEKLSNRDDIWYATNIEIYDYVNAYYSLKYSADGSTIYNPTLYEIWFTIDMDVYSIKPGETLKLD